MKSLEQVLEAIKDSKTWERGANSMLDSRDYVRLAPFALDKLDLLGLTLKEGSSISKREWTTENIMRDFRGDLQFALGKAFDERGISAELMFEVVAMYLWILEDVRFVDEEYRDYGKRILNRIAKEYFPELVVEYT